MMALELAFTQVIAGRHRFPVVLDPLLSQRFRCKALNGDPPHVGDRDYHLGSDIIAINEFVRRTKMRVGHPYLCVHRATKLRGRLRRRLRLQPFERVEGPGVR